MKRALLDALIAVRAERVPAALVRDLASGAQALVAGATATGELKLTPALTQAVAEALREDRSGRLSAPDENIFVQVFNPPVRLLIVGAVHIAQALAPMAALAGYEVVVIDPRRAFATDARFPDVRMIGEWPDEALATLKPDRRTAVVTLTHDPKLDDPALTAALDSGCFYIGSLGSKKTHNARLLRLRNAGKSEEALSRIHGPVGLAIGASSPAEIALAIMAQITQVRRQKPAAPAASEAA